ncbi:MAG: efflux RND transporter permease subunit [Deltaproteobacteria bacterium]|nr:efflux RND transporter permease subunit [Deltaproteobacteria bacterium]
MKFSRFAVNYPVFTIMSVFIVMILGGISLSRLPIDLMPDITYPTLSISTEYENASPKEIEELITRPIEEAMSAVPGVEQVTSISAEGVSQVRVSFTWATDLDAAANDVRDRLDRVISVLPDEAERPFLRKFDLASFPILFLGASSKLDPVQMRLIIDEQIKYRIERLPGVATLDVAGGLDREIHVNLNGDKIKALGLPLDQLLLRIRAENVTVPAGTIERGVMDVTLRTPGEYTDLEELRNTVIAVRAGAPIQLKEIAEVEDSWQKVRRIVRVNGRPGVRLAVMKQSGMNTVEVASGVLKEIERLNQDFPQIHISPIIDTSDYIKRAINNVGNSIFYGGILAVFVLFLFLRNVRSTLVVSTAIPISMIATFTLMYFGGFTLNLMTLGGLALGVGMLVDSAIVVLENIFRLNEAGTPPRRAAIDGSEEVSAAILASTLTTLVVFLPMIFVRGMAGVMFKQFIYVVSFALACSLASALTVVPMLSSLILKPVSRGELERPGVFAKMYLMSGRSLKSLEDTYKRIIEYALNHPKRVLSAAFLLLAGSLSLFPLVGSEFMPQADEGEVRIYTEMETGTRVDVVEKSFDIIEKIIARDVPEVRNTISFIGGTPWRAKGSHTGELRIALKPESERSRSSEEIAADLRQKLSRIPGTIVRTRAGQGLFVLRMGQSNIESVTVEVRGYDLETAEILAQKVKSVMERVEGVTDVQLSRESGSPEENIIVDRQKAAGMKVTVSQIAETLKTILAGQEAGYFREAGKEYTILVKLKEGERMDTRELLDFTVLNAEGEAVVLRNFVEVRPSRGPVFIERKDQERMIAVSANTTDRDLGSITKDIESRLRSIPVPRDFTIAFGTDYEEQQKAFHELLISIILALVLVYMVMASLYESLLDPLIVMFSVPLAAIGVILMLFLSHTTFNIQSYIGCIMLGGIVVNNAILLVDHSNLLFKRGMPFEEAIKEAGRRRLRPILMTALTTSFALTPLAFGLGEGGETQAPMARVVIGGLLSSTLITLVVVPTVYSLFKVGRARKEVLQERTAKVADVHPLNRI